MHEFWICFVPLFVAVDAVGVLPMFIGLVQDMDEKATRRIIYQSVLTAAAVAFAFLAVGTYLLGLMGITVFDFMIAGGCLLFIISMTDLLSAPKARRQVDPESMGAVPLGVPLIAGPGVLTTSILLLNEHGLGPTAVSLALNLLIAGVAFRFADAINRVIGKTGSKILSKIASLLLAAIAVMMVRRGIVGIVLAGGKP